MEQLNKHYHFKGVVSQDFLAIFLFHESKQSGPLINRLKWFFLKVRFCRDIREQFNSAQANTAQANTARSKTNFFDF